MNKSIVLAATLLLALAGCIGDPSTQASPGDRVAYEMRFWLPDGSPLGPAVDGEPIQVPAAEDDAAGVGAHLSGLTVGEVERLQGTLLARERVFGPFSAVGQISVQQFQGLFGQPEPGMEFSPQEGFYDFRVEAVEGDTVVYRAIPESGQEDPVPVLGSTLVTTVAGDDLLQTLVPMNGTPITIRPPSPQEGTPLDLPPGAYVAAGSNATHIFYWSFEEIEDGQALEGSVTLTIRRIDRTALVPVLDDNLGVRESPQLQGDDPPDDTPADDHDDDHDHAADDGHGH